MTENTNENKGNSGASGGNVADDGQAKDANQKAKPIDQAPEQQIRAEEAERRLTQFKEFMRENLDWLSKELDLHRQGFSAEDRVRLNP